MAQELRQPESIAETKRRLWMPPGAIDETQPRAFCNSVLNLVSGTLKLNGGAVIRTGVPVTSITFFSTVTTVAPTNLWYCLVRESDNAVLAKTADDTTTVWTINTFKTLAITGGPYVPTADAAVWLGIMSKATSTPAAIPVDSLSSGSLLTLTEPGPWSVNADAGLTTPASLGATVTPVATALGTGYAYYS